MSKKENIKDWNPTFQKYNRKKQFFETIPYAKSWFCNDKKIIHNSEKEVLNCKTCKEIYE
jgi:hypothetical protein